MDGLPPEVKDGRDGPKEIIKLLNALRRNAGVFANDSAFWLSTANASLPGAVDIGALPVPGGLLKVDIATGYATPSIAAVNVDFPSADAFYVVTRATDAPPNAFNLGGLSTGVLQQTMAAGVATVTTVTLTPGLLAIGAPDGRLAQQTLTPGEVGYGGATGALAQSPDFFYDAATVRVGIGTSAPATTLVLQRDIDSSNDIHVVNGSAGTHALSGIVLQAANGDTVPTPSYFAFAQLGRNYVSPPSDNTPYFAAHAGAISYFGFGDVVFDAHFDAGKSFLWTTRNGLDVQTLRMALDNDGYVSVPETLGAGGIVWADPATAPVGRLRLVTTGTGVSFDPTTGTLSATGSGGTVTAVTASDGLSSSGGTTPNITHDDSTLASGAHGSTGIASFTTDINGHVTAFTGANYQAAGNYITALTGDVTASGPGSVAATIANNAVTNAKFRQSAGLSVVGVAGAATANVADITATTNGQVLRMAGGTIGWGSIPVASVTGAQPTITWPASPQVLYSTGTGSDPTGTQYITIDGASNQLRIIGTNGNQAWYNLLSGIDSERVLAYWTGDVWTLEQQATGSGTVRGMQITSALGLNAGPDAIGAGYMLTVQATATRDRAWYAVGGVTVSDGVNREWFTVNPASTTVDTNNISLLATVRVRATDYTLTGVSASLVASVYADQPTFNGGTVSNPGTSCWVYYAGGGTSSQSNFEGTVISNAIVSVVGQFAGNGSWVFDLPPDATGNTSAAFGRIPVQVAGITKYLRYYND